MFDICLIARQDFPIHLVPQNYAIIYYSIIYYITIHVNIISVEKELFDHYVGIYSLGKKTGHVYREKISDIERGPGNYSYVGLTN